MRGELRDDAISFIWHAQMWPVLGWVFYARARGMEVLRADRWPFVLRLETCFRRSNSCVA